MKLFGKYTDLVVTEALCAIGCVASLWIYFHGASKAEGASANVAPMNPLFLIFYYVMLIMGFMYWLLWVPKENKGTLP